MNTANNCRRRMSQEKIEAAFLELLQQKELSAIHVTELCKRSGLNRSTFYANYQDVYDLAEQVLRRLENEVRHLYQQDVQKGYDDAYLRLFRHVRNNQPLYRVYFRLGRDRDFRLEDFGYDGDLFRQHFHNEDVEYHVEFFRSGLNAILKRWLLEGCQRPPEEMERILRSEYRGRVPQAAEPEQKRS